MAGTEGFLNPQKVLDQLEVKSGWRIGHFGCGHGYFTIPMASLVGGEGVIFAIDILQDALDEVRSKAEEGNLKNIETVRGNLELVGGSKLKSDSCDMVLLANILFESQKKEDIVKEASRVLKAGGEVVIIDWANGAGLTSDSGWRISAQQAQALAESQNFKLEKKFDAGGYHYGLVLRKF
ncbi:MAG: class I SAM-dependent methyltransferase [bacterium]